MLDHYNYVNAKHLLSDNLKSECETHLQTLSVQSKFCDPAKVERSCRTWHQLMSGFHLGQLLFLLHTASDTLPTAVNLRQWCVQSDVKCTLRDSIYPFFHCSHPRWLPCGFNTTKIHIPPQPSTSLTYRPLC